MQLIAIVTVLSIVVASNVFADEIDIGLNNPELVEKTVLCLEGKGTCSKFGQKAKVALVEIAEKGECSSCSKQEQARAYDIIKRFRAAYPDLYRRVLAKYRPQGVPQDVPSALKALAGDHPSKPIKA